MLSVIITNYNTRDLLAACLRSASEYLADDRYEFIVTDNASTDGSIAMVEKDFPRVKPLALEENRGFSRANNLGIQNSRGKYILILNSDTEFQDDAIGKMLQFMESDRKIGALGPQLLNSDKTVQLSCRRFPSYSTALFHRYSLLTRLFPGNKYSSAYLMTDEGHTQTREVDWVSGAAMLVRRETIEKVGLLDEAFFMYAEDVDWCYRMKQAGWKVVYFPTAKIVHHIGQSTRKVPFKMTYERHRSMWRFYRKHYSRGIALIDVATMLGIAGRCLIMMLRNLLKTITRGERRS